MSVEKAKAVAEIAKIAQDVYHAWSDRREVKRKEEADQARRIKELEAEIERLKAGAK